MKPIRLAASLTLVLVAAWFYGTSAPESGDSKTADVE
jgi:hypothetical protein